jgi:hypothetical protein
MSRETISDIVPFIFRAFEFDGIEDDELGQLLDPEAWVEEYCEEFIEDEENFDYDQYMDNFKVRGWHWTPAETLGKRGRLSGDKWTKGSVSVFLVNESTYSNVGYYETAIVADSYDAVKAFYLDWQDVIQNPLKIESEDSASITV